MTDHPSSTAPHVDTTEGVGIVETQVAHLPVPAGGFDLENGGRLPELVVAYETYGKLSADKDNAIYICHALTGDAHVAGYHSADDPKPGWWDQMVGPGRGIDTSRYFVICANILGGCEGTTGPSSISPQTGKPYGSTFPEITVADIVNVQHALIKHLGIARLHAVVGGSLGGMQVIEWGIQHGNVVDCCVCIASTMQLSAQALAFDIVGRNAIEADPAWRDGDYYDAEDQPSPGLAQARMIGHITYLSPEIMAQKFGRTRRDDDQRFQVESYLEYQGAKFVERFDANSYLHITQAMDTFDVSEKYGGIDQALRQVQSRFLVVALSSDWLFPPGQSIELSTALLDQHKPLSYCLLQAPYGHDAFLVDIEHLSDVVGTFLARPPDSESGTVATSTADRAAERWDDQVIEAMIEPGARVIDLGCGDGSLMQRLATRRQAATLGVDIDLQNIIQVFAKNLDAIHCDVDDGLAMIPDQSYDYAILGQTLQVVHRPRQVVREMLRVAREGIVSFPNFARWSHRMYLGLQGRMPKSRTLPFEWYDTPNIHLATLKDFIDLCRADGIRILDIVCKPNGALGRVFLALGLRNLGADSALVRITRDDG